MDLNIDPVHIAWRCGTEDQTRRVVSDLEGALAEAKARRAKILADISKANVAAFAGDKRQLFVLGGLNKQDAETGRLIISIERQITEARKRLAMVEAHAATAAAAKANGDAVAEGAERLFLVNTPHHLHQVRHKARSMEALRSRLLPGYTIQGEIFGANDAGEGGVVAAIEPTGPSIMAGLLAAHGKELEEWLAARGIVGGDKTTVVLPSNGRDLQ